MNTCRPVPTFATDRNRKQLGFNMRVSSRCISHFYLVSQKGLQHQSRYVLHLVNMPQHGSVPAAYYAFLKWVVIYVQDRNKSGILLLLPLHFRDFIYFCCEINTRKIFSSCCSFFKKKSYPVAFAYN